MFQPLFIAIVAAGYVVTRNRSIVCFINYEGDRLVVNFNSNVSMFDTTELQQFFNDFGLRVVANGTYRWHVTGGL